MSNVFIDFYKIFHVKMTFSDLSTLWKIIKSTYFTINSENDFKNVLRIETSGIQKLLIQIGIPLICLVFSYIVTALNLSHLI